MTIYGDLDESILREFRSSTKETLEDIALDEEEKNKIIFNISGSTISKLRELRVDFSDFSNHVFFGSAYSSVNFAINRIIDYPFVGELKDVNEWRDINTGYENWFFDNFPKDHGYIYLSGGSLIEGKDFEGKMGWGTGSFTIEAIIDPDQDFSSNMPIFSLRNSNSRGLSFFLGKVSTTSSVFLNFFSSSTLGGGLVELYEESVSASIEPYIGSPFHIAVSYRPQLVNFYINGDLFASSSLSGAISIPMASGSWSDFYQNKVVHIGYTDLGITAHFSGSIDELRFWGKERPSELINRNKFKTIYANKSGSLQLYYKFNENWLTGTGEVVDYSGNGINGKFSGTFVSSVNYISGTFLPQLVDPGDLILDLNNSDVNSFIEIQRNSGSLYDESNSNYIFELYPHFMTEDEGSEDIAKFLLLIARHWDRLKLYIEHLSNIYNTTVENYDDTPSSLINLVAKHFGIDIGGVYESSDSLQYFFGDNISTGSFDSNLKNVRDQIKRNVLNNLVYFYKSKSTVESIKSAIRSLGLNDDIVNVNQYSILSSGIKTNYEPKVVERKALYFNGEDSRYITLHSASWDKLNSAGSKSKWFEFRVLLDSGSYALSSSFLTASLFEVSGVMALDLFRENASSSLGRIALYQSNSSTPLLTSSFFDAFSNNWINISHFRTQGSFGSYGFQVSSLDRDEIKFHLSESSLYASGGPPTSTDPVIKIGSRNGNPLHGYIQEVRVWNEEISQNSQISSSFIEHTKDFESLSLRDFNNIDKDLLFLHLRLDDFTGSSSGTAPLHDYVDSKSGSTAHGISSSVESNFHGLFIQKMQPSYSYDLNIDNEKIRIKDRDKFENSDISEDLQFVSIDFSPVDALNKEIIKWFGGIEKFSNIVGYPYLRYRDEISQVNSYRTRFFESRMNGGIDFESYLDIIKWFDSNFTFFLSQLLPLDLVSSLSNFVIEPHIFEYNKVKNIFPYADESQSRVISSSISIISDFTASSVEFVPVADPGRFGAFGSASAVILDHEIDYSSSYKNITDPNISRDSSPSINYKESEVRNLMKNLISQSLDQSNLTTLYATGYQFNQISSSNFEKSSLNAVSNFYVSGTNYKIDVIGSGGFGLTSSYGKRTSTISPDIERIQTSSIVAVQDQRWLYYKIRDSAAGSYGVQWDFGIGYGGAAGQLWNIVHKSIWGVPYLTNTPDTDLDHIGQSVDWNRAVPEFWVKTTGTEELRKVVILWPNTQANNGVRIDVDASSNALIDGAPAARFGEPINIEGYNNLFLEIVGNTSEIETKVLSCSVKFQFFDEQYTSQGFETVASSSILASQGLIKTRNMDHEYELAVNFGSNNPSDPGTSESFRVSLERELPASKFMRVYIDPDPNGTFVQESLPGGFYNLIVRGVLTNKSEAKDLVKFRNQ